MNAGAFGGETWNLVKSVEMMPVGGKIRQANANEFEVATARSKTLRMIAFINSFKIKKNENHSGQEQIKTAGETRFNSANKSA